MQTYCANINIINYFNSNSGNLYKFTCLSNEKSNIIINNIRICNNKIYEK